MSLQTIKWYIRTGLFQEARKLIDKEQNIEVLMNQNESENNNLPLLVMTSLIKDEEYALSLSRLLIEKGYRIELCDPNGLCALNYAIALQRKKMLNLLLTTFHFELDKYRDRYKNSFLHYIYATNNPQLIKNFTQIYSKYYEFSEDMLKKMVNCDGLSVQDLQDYSNYMKQRRSLRLLRLNRGHSVANLSNLDGDKFDYKPPECFKLDSNPILISKYINQVFNSNSTMKSDLIFVVNNTHHLRYGQKMTKQELNKSNQANVDFKLNILYQIKSLNKPTQQATSKYLTEKLRNNKILHLRKFNFSTMSNPESVLKTNEKMIKYAWNFDDETEYQFYKFSNNVVEPITWRTEINQLFGDYSTINSPSYRASSAMILKILNKDNPVVVNPSVETTNPDGVKISESPNLANNVNSKAKDKESSGRAEINNSPTNPRKVKSPHQQMAKVDNYLVPGSLLKSKR